MLKLLRLAAFIGLIAMPMASCKKKVDPNPTPIPPVTETPGEETDHEKYTVTKTNQKISIQFKPQYLPANTVTIEVIWAGKYQGYYPINEPIILPYISGRQVLQVKTSDKDGNQFGSVLTYYVQL